MRPRLATSLLLVATLASATSVAADAAVTFNFQTSRGFVDRSAVQDAFGLNNGQMQKRAAQVVFSARQTYTLAAVCENGDRHEAFGEISGIVDFTTAPAKGSFDAFALSGLHQILIADPGPVEEICGGPGRFDQIGVVRTLSASLGVQSAVILEEPAFAH
jgi:hypothetical protein